MRILGSLASRTDKYCLGIPCLENAFRRFALRNKDENIAIDISTLFSTPATQQPFGILHRYETVRRMAYSGNFDEFYYCFKFNYD